MYNEKVHSFAPVLLQLPNGQEVFNQVWEKSALAAVFGLIALVAGVVTWFLWKELKTERKTHREDCDKKDEALAAVNKLFQDEMAATRLSTMGLINKLQLLESKTDVSEMRDELGEVAETLGDVANSLKRGLRAIGRQMDIPSERLGVD